MDGALLAPSVDAPAAAPAPAQQERPRREAAAPASPGSPASPRAALQNLLQRDRPQVQRCYERLVPAQLRSPTRLLFALVFGPDGAVRSATVTGLGNAPVEQCIATVVRRWRLPAVPGGARMSVPFLLQPR